MPVATLDLPGSQLAETLRFAKELDYYSNHDRLIINIKPKMFFSPFSMLFLAAKIKKFTQKCPGTTLIFNGWDLCPYLSHMGFFDMCGFVHGKDVGAAWGSANYLPITRITRDSFYVENVDKYEELPDLIQRHVDEVSRILVRNNPDSKNIFDVLSYSIREMFRNVFEHSESDSLLFCAQYWPKSNKVEFSVVDFGVGIRKGLATNPNFRFKTDKEAIEYSLLPSVSGKTHERRVSSNWFNSGYGLYMTNRLARNGGSFVIASGDSAIHMTKKTKYNYQTSFAGTALRVNLNVDEIGGVQARLNEFRKDGQVIASKISGSGNRPPSAMSLLLRRDYQP